MKRGYLVSLRLAKDNPTEFTWLALVLIVRIPLLHLLSSRINDALKATLEVALEVSGAVHECLLLYRDLTISQLTHLGSTLVAHRVVLIHLCDILNVACEHLMLQNLGSHYGLLHLRSLQGLNHEEVFEAVRRAHPIQLKAVLRSVPSCSISQHALPNAANDGVWVND